MKNDSPGRRENMDKNLCSGADGGVRLRLEKEKTDDKIHSGGTDRGAVSDS